jgi:hypothetical protein
MKLLKNFAKFSEGNPEPGLRFRYNRGLGDFTASLLHSKYIGIITHKITGEKTPCQKCLARSMALNVLFPIPFWKLFFSSEEEMVESLKNDLTKAGYKVEGFGPKEFSATKTTHEAQMIPPKPEFETAPNQTPPIDSNYELVGMSDNYIGEFKIQTLIYKHK